jgi:hypothetical protein
MLTGWKSFRASRVLIADLPAHFGIYLWDDLDTVPGLRMFGCLAFATEPQVSMGVSTREPHSAQEPS